MGNFGFPISALDLPQLVLSMLREEWRCALMEHLEQSVMWAGTNWMLKLLAVNLASTQQVSVGRHPCFVTTLETVAGQITTDFPYRIASIEWFRCWSLVWPCLPGECDV